MALNFHGSGNQEKFLNGVTRSMCKTIRKLNLSELAAYEAIMFTGTFWSASLGVLSSCKRSDLSDTTPLGCTFCTARTFCHHSSLLSSRFAVDIAHEGMASEGDSMRLETSSLCLKFRKKAIATHLVP